MVYGLTSDSHLVSFKPLTPGTLRYRRGHLRPVGSEAIVGIDFRPADGQLYALTDAGHLYVVDYGDGRGLGLAHAHGESGSMARRRMPDSTARASASTSVRSMACYASRVTRARTSA